MRLAPSLLLSITLLPALVGCPDPSGSDTSVAVVDTCPAASLRVDGQPLDGAVFAFEGLELGATATTEITVTNDCEGPTALELRDVVVEADDAFSVTGPAVEAGALELSAGESTTLTIAYAAADYGPHEGRLSMATSDPAFASLGFVLAGSPNADQDGDGVLAVEAGGTDCDDADPEVRPGATEVDNNRDDDCDGVADEDFLAPGDVWLSEFFREPREVTPEVGQWFELVNVSERTVNLQGWTFGGESGAPVTIEEALVLEPGARAVLAVDEAALGEAGSPDATYAYEAYPMGDEGVFHLQAGDLTVFYLEWDSSWPRRRGGSTTLDVTVTDAAAATQPRWWCAGYRSGNTDLSVTPGEDNIYCITVDHDGDGFSEADGDCDDTEPLAYPGSDEVWDNADNDCDGDIDDVAVDEVAIAWLPGGAANRQLGNPGFLGVGDPDGDGVTDLIAVEAVATTTTYGRALVVPAGDALTNGGSALGTEIASVSGTSFQQRVAGVPRQLSDHDGDGIDDLVVFGNAYNFQGTTDPVVGIFTVDDLDTGLQLDEATLALSGLNANLGSSGIADLDLTGDGTAEIVIGNPYANLGGGFGYRGAMYVLDVAGFEAGSGDLDDYSIGAYTTNTTYSGFAGSFGGGDADGDGYDDLIVRSGVYLGFSTTPALYMMLGDRRLTTQQDITRGADVTVSGFTTVTQDFSPGWNPVLADLDGDGTVDLAAGDPGANQVVVFLDIANAGSELDVSDADVEVEGGLTAFGSATDAGDVTGDGIADLIVGAPAFTRLFPAPVDPGEAFVFPGGTGFLAGGRLDRDDTSATFSTDEVTGLGKGVRLADLDGDGGLDLLLSAPLTDGNAGRIWLVEGP